MMPNPQSATDRAVGHRVTAQSLAITSELGVAASGKQIGRLAADLAKESVDVDAAADFIVKKALRHPGVTNVSVRRDRWHHEGRDEAATWNVFVLNRAGADQVCGSSHNQPDLDRALSLALADFDSILYEAAVADRVKKQIAEEKAAQAAVDAEKSREYIQDAKVAGLAPIQGADGVFEIGPGDAEPFDGDGGGIAQ